MGRCSGRKEPVLLIRRSGVQRHILLCAFRRKARGFRQKESTGTGCPSCPTIFRDSPVLCERAERRLSRCALPALLLELVQDLARAERVLSSGRQHLKGRRTRLILLGECGSVP